MVKEFECWIGGDVLFGYDFVCFELFGDGWNV